LSYVQVCPSAGLTLGPDECGTVRAPGVGVSSWNRFEVGFRVESSPFEESSAATPTEVKVSAATAISAAPGRRNVRLRGIRNDPLQTPLDGKAHRSGGLLR